MENFIYSINVTMPIFLVMVLGYFLKQIGMLDDNFVTVANRFNFKVTLPFMLFRDISTVDIKAVFDLKYVLFCAIVSTICFWTVWAGAKLFLKDKSMRGAFVQASFRGSAANLPRRQDKAHQSAKSQDNAPRRYQTAIKLSYLGQGERYRRA